MVKRRTKKKVKNEGRVKRRRKKKLRELLDYLNDIFFPLMHKLKRYTVSEGCRRECGLFFI